MYLKNFNVSEIKSKQKITSALLFYCKPLQILVLSLCLQRFIVEGIFSIRCVVVLVDRVVEEPVLESCLHIPLLARAICLKLRFKTCCPNISHFVIVAVLVYVEMFWNVLKDKMNDA